MGIGAASAATRGKLMSSAQHAASAAVLAMAELRMHVEQAIESVRRRALAGTSSGRGAGGDS